MPENATPEGRLWARLTANDKFQNGFHNIRASCYNLERSPVIRTLSLRIERLTGEDAQNREDRLWTLNEVVELRLEGNDFDAAIGKRTADPFHPPGTTDMTAWRALVAVLRALMEDDSWDSFATTAIEASTSPRGVYPAAVELKLRTGSSPDDARQSLAAPIDRLARKFATIGRVSHECGVDPEDPNNRKHAGVSLRVEFRWDTAVPVTATPLGDLMTGAFPPPAYRYELKGKPRPKPASESRPAGK